MKKALLYSSITLTMLWLIGCHDDDDMPVRDDQVIIQDNLDQLKDRVSHDKSGLISINGGSGTNQRTGKTMNINRQAQVSTFRQPPEMRTFLLPLWPKYFLLNTKASY